MADSQFNQFNQFNQFSQFLQEATDLDPTSGVAFGRNRLYGLYTSWCFLSNAAPGPEDAFWAAMKQQRIRPGRTMLRMKGPAAADYILSSAYPGMA